MEESWQMFSHCLKYATPGLKDYKVDWVPLILLRLSSRPVRPRCPLLINPANHWNFVSFQILKASQFIPHWPWLVSVLLCEPRRPSDNTQWSHVTSLGKLIGQQGGKDSLSLATITSHASLSQYSHSHFIAKKIGEGDISTLLLPVPGLGHPDTAAACQPWPDIGI